jgi:hypothetical protein
LLVAARLLALVVPLGVQMLQYFLPRFSHLQYG